MKIKLKLFLITISALKLNICCGQTTYAMNESLPLFEAVAASDIPGIQTLLMDGIDINMEDEIGRTALNLAIQLDDKKITTYLLSIPEIDINLSDKNGLSPLHWAVINNNGELLNLLLSHGADINVQEIDGWTPLHLALKSSPKEIIAILLKYNAKTNIRNSYGQTAVHFVAIYVHNKEILNLLFSKIKNLGAPPLFNIKDHECNTPLHLAAYSNNHWAIDLLIKAGANHKIKNKCGLTPLQIALAKPKIYKDYKIINLLKNLELPTKSYKDKIQEGVSQLAQLTREITSLANLKN